MNRRQFLSSLSRSALVLPFADVLRLARRRGSAMLWLLSRRGEPARSAAVLRCEAHAAPARTGIADCGNSAGRPVVDVAMQSGLNAKTIFGGEGRNKYLLETTGCGVAFYDYDQDGWLDIFLVNGWRLEGFPRSTKPSCHLFRNNRDGTFTDVTAKQAWP